MDQRPDKILRAQCLLCEDAVESVSRRDFRYCSCKNIMIVQGTGVFRKGPKDSFVFLKEDTNGTKST